VVSVVPDRIRRRVHVCADTGTPFVCAVALRALAVMTIVSMAAAASAQTIAGGDGHTLVVKPDGTVWAMGVNSSGQIGD
jgi:alpha-tubulin suppressor-like RCC1 family protein